MPLGKSKEFRTGMAFLDCIDFIGSELVILGTVRQPKLPHAIVDNKLATPTSHASE